MLLWLWNLRTDENSMKDAKRQRIYTIVRGGLGNQLFIYAAARALSEKIDGEIVLLDDLYENEFHGRKLLIRNFVPDCKIESKNQLPAALSHFSYSLARHLNRYAHFIGLNTGAIFIERRKRLFKIQSERFDKRFANFHPKRDCLLDGFFQDEWYFADQSDIIRSELCAPRNISDKTLDLAKKIQSTPNAVAVHFRRTEMECRDISRRHAGQLIKYRSGADLSFYRKAFEYINARLPNAKLFGFSDYPEWMIKNADIGRQILLVTHNNRPDTAHEDLYLMSLCRHHIISHSTFGWWAAWLAYHPEQIVIAPIDVNVRPKSPFFPDHWKTFEVERDWANQSAMNS